MYPAGNLFIPAAHGRLEAIIKEPRRLGQTDDHSTDAQSATVNLAQQNSTPTPVALVLHPHPQHGGTMHNKVVFRAARGLENAGLITLRINFRGVGLSTGEYDEARGEQEDARTALDYLLEKYPNADVTLAGFSFGSRVALKVGIADERVRRLISIGTPVNMYPYEFARECRKPTLFVHGERDEFGDVARLREVVATLPTEAKADLKVINGAGHFFDEQLTELTDTITEWTIRQLNDEVRNES